MSMPAAATAAASTASPAPALSLAGITKRFGSLTAVDNLSLTIARHEVVGLIGENGAGKSTLLKILTGVHQPDQGTISVNGQPARFRTPMEANAAGIGIVHQEQSLFTNLTVAENIVMGAGQGAVRFGVYNWGQARRQAAEILARIGSPIDPATRVGDLSFAHRQMVEIARTIEVARAGTRTGGSVPVVILDEPTSVLERGESEILEREIQKLKNIGSVIFVSHRLEEVLRICDRIVVMRHGRIVADRPRAGITEDDLFELMIGQSARASARMPSAPLGAGQPVLRAGGLTRQGAFREVSLSVYPGRVAAIVGTFGSGREEFCRALFGAEEFGAGRLWVSGSEVRRWSVRKAVAAGLAYLPAERGVEGVVGGLSAERNLTLVHPGDSASGIFLRPGKRKEMARDWFERLDVRPREPGLELERFSGGNQQKVALAKWMASGQSKVLILDHPLRGLDPGASETVKAHIRTACRNGAGLILLADTLEEALELGDEIMVMRDGEVTARFDMSRETPTTLDLLEKMV